MQHEVKPSALLVFRITGVFAVQHEHAVLLLVMHVLLLKPKGFSLECLSARKSVMGALAYQEATFTETSITFD